MATNSVSIVKIPDLPLADTLASGDIILLSQNHHRIDQIYSAGQDVAKKLSVSSLITYIQGLSTLNFGYNVSAYSFTSTAPQGAIPLIITSNTLCPNLNAQYLNGISLDMMKITLALDNVTNESKATMLNNAALTGVSTAPTAAVNTNTQQIASTQFVLGQASTSNPLAPSTAASGISYRYSREDHVHPLNFTSNVTDIQMNGTQSLGTSTLYPRADHTHPSDTTKANLSGATFTGAVSGVSFNAITGLSSSLPVMDGTATIGTSTTAAKSDHIHPTDTSRAAINQTMYIGTTSIAINRASAALTLTGITLTSPTLTTPSIGVATGTSFNSITGLSSAVPTMNGTGTIGTATDAARADHIHPTDTTLLSLSGGTLTGPVNFNSATLAAAGSTQGTATLVSADNVFITSGTGGVVLPTATIGREITITNNTGSSVNIYPAVGAQIENSTANIPTILPSYATIGFAAKSTTQWWTTTPVYNNASGITITQSANGTVTFGIDSTVVTLTGSQTLTNKTLTAPNIGVATGTSFNSITGLSNTNPLSNGTASQGTSTLVSRQDHVHPTDTSRQATLVSGTNIKTINSESLLGPGNITISGDVLDGDKGDITVSGSGATWTVDVKDPYGFFKLSSASPAFLKTAAGTASVKAGTKVMVSATLVSFATNTAIVMPTLTGGTDYAIYACTDGTCRADASFTAPTGYDTTNSRLIGGFHYGLVAAGTTVAGGSFATTGNGMIWTQADVDRIAGINEFSLWDLKWRPLCDPKGMALVAGKVWVDIYFCGTNHPTNGTSKAGTDIASGTVLPKKPYEFGGNGTVTYSAPTWWDFVEIVNSYKKRLMREQEFVLAAFGVTENQSIDVTASTYPTTQRNAGYTSKYGIEQATGHHWTWGEDTGQYGESWTWQNTNGGRGQVYMTSYNTRVILGGNRTHGAYSGSRCSGWGNYPWSVNWGVGVRAACDHLTLL